MLYMRSKDHRRVFDIEKLEPQRLVMKWQTEDNYVDCGIFAMRHMETYFGGGTRAWNSKLAIESVMSNTSFRLFQSFSYFCLIHYSSLYSLLKIDK